MTLQNMGNGKAKITIQPGNDHAGNYSNVTVSAVDKNGNYGNSTFSLTVIAADPLPAANQKVKALYNGLIASTSWRTERAATVSDQDFTGMYLYDYDDKYQIKEANWAEPNFVANTYALSNNRFRLAAMQYDPNGNIKKLHRYDEFGMFTNRFEEYAYETNTNKLQSVTGYTNLYTYNKISQMTGQDRVEGDDQYVEYDVTGKVTKVFSNKNSTTQVFENLKVEYIYDDRGFRMAKVNYNSDPKRTTWYIRDASGNIISIYEQEGTPYDQNGAIVENSNPLDQTEVPLYGSGKLATLYPGQNSSAVYELTDHLGNVRALMRDNTNVYVATMEDSGVEDFTNPRVEEMQYFENLTKTSDQNVAMNHTLPGGVESPDKAAYLYWVDGMNGIEAEDRSVGPAMALQVRPGDVVEIETWAKFERQLSYNRDVVLGSLSTFLGTNFLGKTGFEGLTSGQIANSVNAALMERRHSPT
jgi:hypothetical protein